MSASVRAERHAEWAAATGLLGAARATAG